MWKMKSWLLKITTSGGIAKEINWLQAAKMANSFSSILKQCRLVSKSIWKTRETKSMICWNSDGITQTKFFLAWPHSKIRPFSFFLLFLGPPGTGEGGRIKIIFFGRSLFIRKQSIQFIYQRKSSMGSIVALECQPSKISNLYTLEQNRANSLCIDRSG